MRQHQRLVLFQYSRGHGPGRLAAKAEQNNFVILKYLFQLSIQLSCSIIMEHLIDFGNYY